MQRSRSGFRHEMRKNRILYLMLLPAILLVVMMNYIPMSGLIVAFKNFQYNLGIFGSDWAKNHGFDNFRFLFLSGKGWSITFNTAFYNLANLLSSQLLGLLLAIAITEMTGRVFKRVTQSLIFLPYFISWIIVGSFSYNFFNYEIGSLNNLIKATGGDPINLYLMPNAWIWVIMAFNSWKWAGYNSIIFIAAITAIDAECFESADIDGANIWQKIRAITIPSIRPTIIIVLLLNISRILRGDFQMFFQLVGMNGQLFDATDVIDTFVFRSLISGGDVGMTAAATLYQSVLCFAIIMLVNGVVKRIDTEYALF